MKRMKATTLLLTALSFSLLLGHATAKGEYGQQDQKLIDDNKHGLRASTAREPRRLQEPSLHPTHPPRRRQRTPSPIPILLIAPTPSPSLFPSSEPSAVPTETFVQALDTTPSVSPSKSQAPTGNVNPRNAPTVEDTITPAPTRTESPTQDQSCVTLLPFSVESTTPFEDTGCFDEALEAYLNVYFSAREPDIIQVDIPPPKPEILFRRLQRQQELTYSLPYDNVQACFPDGLLPDKSVLDGILVDSLTESFDTFASFLQFALSDHVIPDVIGSTFESSEPPSPAPSKSLAPSASPSAGTPTDSPKPSPAPSGMPSSGPSASPTITPMPSASLSPTFITRHITVLPFNVISSDPIVDRQALLEATVVYLNTNFATGDDDFVEFVLQDIGSQPSGSGDSLQLSGIGIYKGDSPVSFEDLNDEVRKLLDDNFPAFKEFISFAIPTNPPTLLDVIFNRTPAPSISLVPSSTPSVSDVPTGAPTDTAPPSSSVVPTEAPSLSDEPTSTPTISSAPSSSQVPTLAPSVSNIPTSTPTETAFPTETSVPSGGPSSSPTDTASPSISSSPSFVPSMSHVPSIGPSTSPSMSHEPSIMPTDHPSDSPSVSLVPSASPSIIPSSSPSFVPSMSLAPSIGPSTSPSMSHEPSIMPTDHPSDSPSLSLVPSASPSETPSLSLSPSESPTPAPTNSIRLLTKGAAVENMKFLLHEPHELADEIIDSSCSCVNCHEDINCGGLWLGKSVESDPNRFESIRLVISHCQHSLEWVEEYTRGFDIDGITIVSKCGMEVVGLPTFTNTQVIQLANVGRCDHTYANWIAKAASSEDMIKYLQPTSAIVFLKDDISQKHVHQIGFRRSFSEMLGIAFARDFACGIEPGLVDVNGEATSMSVYHETQQLLSFHLDDYQRGNYEMNSHGDAFGSYFRDMGDWAATMGLRFESPVTPVCYGGVFAVKGSQLVGKDDLWKKLETSLLRGNNIEEGHFVERSWAHILSPPTSSTQVEEIVRYSNGIAESESSYSGTLTHAIGRDV